MIPQVIYKFKFLYYNVSIDLFLYNLVEGCYDAKCLALNYAIFNVISEKIQQKCLLFCGFIAAVRSYLCWGHEQTNLLLLYYKEGLVITGS